MTMAATLITGANVWNGISAQAAPGQVLVVDGRIQQLADAIDAPPDARVVDLSGHTLTPGFMDCHVHVTLAPPVGVMMALDSSTAKTLKALPRLRALLMNGFTTVRDLGCGDVDYPTIDLRNAVATATSAEWSPTNTKDVAGHWNWQQPTDATRSAPGSGRKSGRAPTGSSSRPPAGSPRHRTTPATPPTARKR
jgi:imidazolonepropionase-like amidohydrolase